MSTIWTPSTGGPPTSSQAAQNALGSTLKSVYQGAGGDLATTPNPTPADIQTQMLAQHDTGVNESINSILAGLGYTLPAPTMINVSVTTTGGSLPANTPFYYSITALNENGETSPGYWWLETQTGSGAASTITARWLPVDGATGYNFWRATTTDSNGDPIFDHVINSSPIAQSASALSFIDTGAAATPKTANPVSTAVLAGADSAKVAAQLSSLMNTLAGGKTGGAALPAGPVVSTPVVSNGPQSALAANSTGYWFVTPLSASGQEGLPNSTQPYVSATSASAFQVNFGWPAVPSAVAYNVYRSATADASKAGLVGAATTALTFTDYGILPVSQSAPTASDTPMEIAQRWVTNVSNVALISHANSSSMVANLYGGQPPSGSTAAPTPIDVGAVPPGIPPTHVSSILGNTNMGSDVSTVNTNHFNMQDAMLSALRYVAAGPASPTLTVSTTGGSLAAGQYSYSVIATLADGSKTMVGYTYAYTATLTGSTNSVALSWPKLSTAYSYDIWRTKTYTKSTGDPMWNLGGTIATGLSASTTTFTDTAASVTSATIPTSAVASGTDVDTLWSALSNFASNAFGSKTAQAVSGPGVQIPGSSLLSPYGNSNMGADVSNAVYNINASLYGSNSSGRYPGDPVSSVFDNLQNIPITNVKSPVVGTYAGAPGTWTAMPQGGSVLPPVLTASSGSPGFSYSNGNTITLPYAGLWSLTLNITVNINFGGTGYCQIGFTSPAVTSYSSSTMGYWGQEAYVMGNNAVQLNFTSLHHISGTTSVTALVAGTTAFNVGPPFAHNAVLAFFQATLITRD